MNQKLDIPSQMRSLIVTQLGVDEDAVTDEANLIDDLGADSLDIVELVMATEEHFAIEINDDEANQMNTVGDAIKLIEAKVKANAGV